MKNVLSGEMELLHLITDTICVGTQKDKTDGSGQILIDVHVPSYIDTFLAWPIFYNMIR